MINATDVMRSAPTSWSTKDAFRAPEVTLTPGGSNSGEVAANLAPQHRWPAGRHARAFFPSRPNSDHRLRAYPSNLSSPDYSQERQGSRTPEWDAAQLSSTDIADPDRLSGGHQPHQRQHQPLNGCGEYIDPPDGCFYLKHVPSAHIVLVIADEVVRAFGGFTRCGLEANRTIAPRILERIYHGADTPGHRGPGAQSSHATAYAHLGICMRGPTEDGNRISSPCIVNGGPFDATVDAIEGASYAHVS